MKTEYRIADELQGMFLEGKLKGIQETDLNLLTRKLRLGLLSINELMVKHPIFKEYIIDAKERFYR